MAKPDFIIIGAAKAGTTSLYAILDQHPGIFMPRVKEPEFFARDDRYAKGIQSYEVNFDDAKDGQLRGEASTIYSMAPLFPDTAERIKQHNPNAKLIYVMRHPVKRAYSFYVQLVKNYQNVTGDHHAHRSFDDFVLPDHHARAAPREKALSKAVAHFPDTTELCLAGSEYVVQIESYLQHFKPEQFLFLKFEDFVTDPQTCTRKITDFLGIDPISEDVFENPGMTQNVSSTHFDRVQETAKIAGMKRRFGGLWALRYLLPVGMRKALRRNALEHTDLQGSGGALPHKLEPETEQMLSSRFAQQIERLQELTGLDFDDWDLKA